MKKSIPFVVFAFLIGGAYALPYVWAQQQPSMPLPPNPDDVFRPGAVFKYEALPPHAPPGAFLGDIAVPGRQDPWINQRIGPTPIDDPRRVEMHAFGAAVEKLRSAKDDAAKEAAKKELTQLLDQSFTRDLAQREQEVSEIEARVKKLKEQIEKRKKAKEEIIALRLKTIINEVDGLGFSGPSGFERPPGPGGGDYIYIRHPSPTPAPGIEFRRPLPPP